MTIADDLKTIAILDRMTDLIQESWTMKHVDIGDVASALSVRYYFEIPSVVAAECDACGPTDECECCGCSLSSHTEAERHGCQEAVEGVL